MGLRDMFKRKQKNEVTTEGKHTNNTESSTLDFLDSLRQTPSAKNIDHYVQEEARQLSKEFKERYLQEHRYAYILDRLMKHINSGEKLRGDSDYVIAQYNYDKSIQLKQVMFIPYLEEMKKLGWLNENEIPDEIKKFYNEYQQRPSIDKDKFTLLAFDFLQAMGIVNLEDQNAFKGMNKDLRQTCIKRSKDPTIIQNSGISHVKSLPEGTPDKALIQRSAMDDLFRY